MLPVAFTGCERKRVVAFVFATTPLSKARPSRLYLVFFASLMVLALVFFGGRQPQPQSQGLFLLATFITSFYVYALSLDDTVTRPGRQTLEMAIKYLGNYLTTVAKNFSTPFLSSSPKSALEQFVAHFPVFAHIS